MRILSRLFALAVLVATLQGCATCELVEAELRVKNEQVEQLELQVHHMQAEINALRQTVQQYQQEVVNPEKENVVNGSAVAYTTAAISRISFGLPTGGSDANRDGFDEALTVVVSCHDYDGDIFKCPGTLYLRAFEVAGKRTVGEWEFTNEELRDSWRSTLVSQGYQLVIPWQRPPESSPIKLIAEFVTLEGRRFVLEKEIPVSAHPINAVVAEPHAASLQTLPEMRTTAAKPRISSAPQASTSRALPEMFNENSLRPAQTELMELETFDETWSVPPAEHARFQSKVNSLEFDATESSPMDEQLPVVEEAPFQDPPVQRLRPVTEPTSFFQPQALENGSGMNDGLPFPVE